MLNRCSNAAVVPAVPKDEDPTVVIARLDVRDGRTLNSEQTLRKTRGKPRAAFARCLPRDVSSRIVVTM